MAKTEVCGAGPAEKVDESKDRREIPANERAAEYAKYFCFCHLLIWPVAKIAKALGGRASKKS